MAAPARTEPHLVVHLVITMSLLGWLAGTPYFLLGAALTAAPFFGETPSAEEVQQTHLLLTTGFACGLLLPIVGLVTALTARRRAAAWMCVAALFLTVAVLGWYATL